MRHENGGSSPPAHVQSRYHGLLFHSPTICAARSPRAPQGIRGKIWMHLGFPGRVEVERSFDWFSGKSLPQPNRKSPQPMPIPSADYRPLIHKKQPPVARGLKANATFCVGPEFHLNNGFARPDTERPYKLRIRPESPAEVTRDAVFRCSFDRQTAQHTLQGSLV